MLQTTIGQSHLLKGIGLHSGSSVSLAVSPGEPNQGVIFHDKAGGCTIKAFYANYEIGELCTSISSGNCTIRTIEHFMAAINAMGIDNLNVEVDGGELPIFDGSSRPFVDLINDCGIIEQAGTRREFIKIKKPIEVSENDKSVALFPSSKPKFSFDIDFSEKKGPTQFFSIDLDKESFVNEIGFARTFGFYSDIEKLLKAGYAKGGNEDNAIVIGEDGSILNKSGLRRSDEMVRHKILDAIGDLMLAGRRIIGHFVGHKSSHRLTALLVQAMFQQPDRWEIVTA